MLTIGRLVWPILRSRGVLLAIVAGICLLAGVGYGLFAEDRYQAVANLFIDPSAIESGAMGAMGPGARAADLDLLRSERVAQRVVENEHLIEEPELRGIYLESIDLGRPPLEALAHSIAAQIEARTAGDGSVVRLSVVATNAALAARIANGYAQAWGEVGLELRAASIRNGVERAHEGLIGLRAQLGEARARNRDDRNLVVTDERANEQFAQLSRMATRPMHRAAGTTGSASSDAVSAATRQEPASLGDGGVDLSAARMESVVLSGNARVVDAGQAYGVAGAMHGTAATKPSGSLSSAEDEIRLAQQSLERTEDRLARLSAEGVGAPFPVHVLLPAHIPEVSIKPEMAVCVAIGLTLGLLLGSLAMGVAEMADRRVRRASDLAHGLGIVVLGILPVAVAKPVAAQAKPQSADHGAPRWLRWQRADGAA